MTHSQDNTQTQAALLCNDNGIDTPVKNSLCCAAAGIIASTSATTEALIPHEKLREAATPEATLNAQNRPLAQPVVGYMHPSSCANPFPESTAGRKYWPADLTDVQPREWATMSPRHVAEFAGMTEVWLLLDAAQKHIAELTLSKDVQQAKSDLLASQLDPDRFIFTEQGGMEEHDLGEWVAHGAFDHVRGELTEQIAKQALDKQHLQAKVDALQARLDKADQALDDKIGDALSQAVTL